MRSVYRNAIVFAILSFLFLSGVAPAFLSSAVQSNLGYATYSITVSKDNLVSHTVIVNESVRPSPQSGMDIVTLELFSSQANLTYSRNVNASFPFLFPSFPSLSNRSFSYSANNVTVSLSVSNSSSGSQSFGGNTYSTSIHSISVSLSSVNWGSLSGSGKVVAFPSGLVYSAQLSANQSTVVATLITTNLPLTAPSAGSTTTGLVIAGASVSAALAFVVPWQMRRRKKTQAEDSDKDKPSYWVD